MDTILKQYFSMYTILLDFEINIIFKYYITYFAIIHLTLIHIAAHGILNGTRKKACIFVLLD